MAYKGNFGGGGGGKGGAWRPGGVAAAGARTNYAGGAGGKGGGWNNNSNNKGGNNFAKGAGKAGKAPQAVAAQKPYPTPQKPQGQAAFLPVKKEITPAGVSPVPNNPTGKTPVYTVSTQSKNDEVGIMTLVGDYIETGTNHGRKCFQKVQEIPGHKDVKVLLYYWDNRDGADFSGWWFGDKLGGSQVWARCGSHGSAPPPNGWKIPWDAPKAEPGLLSIGGFKGAVKPAIRPAAAPSAGPAGTAGTAAAQAKTAKTQSRVEAVEKSSQAAVQKAKALNKDSQMDTLKKSQDNLQAEQTKLQEAQKNLTQEINETRKTGPSSAVVELSKLAPKLRAAQVSISTEINRFKGLLSGPMNKEQLKKQEEKNSKEFEEALPDLQEVATAVEDALEAVVIMATPILDDPPDDVDTGFGKLVEEIESAANAVQTRVNEGRQEFNTKLQGVKAYAPEAKKTAMAELTALQGKLGEVQKKLNQYKNFKKDFKARVEAKKAVAEIIEKLSSAELEVEKAAMMTTGANDSQMSEEDVKTAEELVTPAKSALSSVSSLVESKMRSGSGALKDELQNIKDRLSESQQRLTEISAICKGQREGFALEETYKTAHEKVDKAEEEMEKCGEAELSFLKGIEVLPQEESEQAIKDSEAAAAATSKAVGAAQGFLKSKLQEVKRYSEKTQKKATEELEELQKRCEAVQKKLSSFKSETAERKVAAQMSEAIDAVVSAEGKLKTLTEIAKVFAADALEKATAESLKTAHEKSVESEKACSTAVNEARKLINQKQRNSGKDGKDMAEGLSKLLERVTAVQQGLGKVKKDSSAADKLVRGKESIAEAEVKLAQAETEVQKVLKLSKPEDEGLGMEKISDQNILEMDALSLSSSKSFRLVNALIASHLASAPEALKATLSKLRERAKKGEATVADVKAKTKDQREEVLSESFVKEGTDATKAVEAAVARIDEVEAPFLKGIDALPAGEATKAMQVSDEVSKEITLAISNARTSIASRNLELKKFEEKNTKTSRAELSKLTEKVNAAAHKLGIFKKETEVRRTAALLMEAGEKVVAFEAEIENVNSALKPILEKDPDTLSPAEASAMIKSLEGLEKSANKQLQDCRNFLAQRSREVKGNAEKEKLINGHQAKLNAAAKEFSEAKKKSGSHSDKLRAKAFVSEAADSLKEAQAELEKATAACAPMLEQKCERFLVQASIRILSKALAEHMEESKISEEILLGKMGSPLNQEKFVDFVAKMPEALKHEECSFSEERRIAMFKAIDVDGDGVVSKDEFECIFTQKYLCLSSISLTDKFEIATSKTLGKIEEGAILEGKGQFKDEEGDTGVSRLQCRTPEINDGKWCWVTVNSNNNKKYIRPSTPINEFQSNLEKQLDQHIEAVGKLGKIFGKKMHDISSSSKDSPLQEAKQDVQKARNEVTEIRQKVEQLKHQLNRAKQDFHQTAAKDRRAHLDAKAQKEADEFTGPVKPLVAAWEAELKKIEELAKPLLDCSTENIQTFATPITVQDDVRAAVAKLNDAVKTAKAKVHEQQEKEAIAKASKGPMFEAKNQLSQWVRESSQAFASGNKIFQRVKGLCKSIARSKFEQALAAMLSEFRASGASVEDAFKKLSNGQDRISEEAFATHLQSLQGLSLLKEHALIVARELEIGGISRRSFSKCLQKFVKVIKEIAITPSFDVVNSKEKPVRKADQGEVFEVIEGPTTEDGTGLERVKVRALTDGAIGWVSMKGNQGRVFLESTHKPFYHCFKGVSLGAEFDSSSAEKKALKAEEVLELLEGPRKETLGSVKRLRAKTTSDGKTGWFTVEDKDGNKFAEKSDKVYTCTATVAITDVQDIKACKVLKKLSPDETFFVTEGPISAEGVERVKGKSSKDDVEGWVTIKGNAGTVYAKVNEKLYTVSKDVVLQSGFKSDSSAIRTLTAGEAIEVNDSPKEERLVPANRAKVKVVSCGTEGWISVKLDVARPWTPNYKVIKAAKLYAKNDSKEDVVRDINAGEALVFQEGPVEIDGHMWIKGSMRKDGAIGWSPIKDDSGKILINGKDEK